ncbi:hypothetical protein AALO_G00167420 [Alosa alosa]|uniref:Uncharacterized protein n=1 Tax=Alosa alosa TaxID=278164 RepID=A0AAV6GCD9_9TELE|nr:hypothetical protein AALO_G00167420 [Alosa alosa]
MATVNSNIVTSLTSPEKLEHPPQLCTQQAASGNILNLHIFECSSLHMSASTSSSPNPKSLYSHGTVA